MKISELDLQERYIEFLNSLNFTTLYPPQADCVSSGLLKNQNLLEVKIDISDFAVSYLSKMLKYYPNGYRNFIFQIFAKNIFQVFKIIFFDDKKKFGNILDH